jgi:hypothetical protein
MGLFYGAFAWPTRQACLDEAFDAPDDEADAELCRGIVAGKLGMHPDAWGNHDPLPLRWLLRKRLAPLHEAAPGDREWRAPVLRPPAPPKPKRPVGRPPGPRPSWWQVPPAPPPAWPRSGTIELTCDECGAAFGPKLDYGRSQRDVQAGRLRALGALSGWTHAGRDRCPACSAPEDEGDSAGEGEGDEQHAEGG